MPTENDPEDLRLVASLFRKRRRWTQQQVADATGIDQSDISKIERGHLVPSRSALERIAEATGVPPGLVPPAIRAVQALRSVAARPHRSPGLDDSSVGDLQSVAEVAVLAAMPAVLSFREGQGTQTDIDDLWTHLKESRDPLLLIEGLLEFQRWELCQPLCELSLEVDTKNPRRALQLANTALRLVTLAPGTEGRKVRLETLCMGHVANAQRIVEDYSESEKSFARTWKLWHESKQEGFPFIPQWRLLDLEASLRRDQRLFPNAFELLDRALAVSGGDEAAGRVLLNRGSTLEQAGRYDEALSVLAQAEPLIERTGDDRLQFRLLFDRAVNLDHLERHDEVAVLLPKVRALTGRLDRKMDLIRLLWLEARVLRNQGRRDEALENLSHVRAAFSKEKMAYNTALATLEVSELLLERNTGQVKALAEDMLWVFGQKGVQPEAEKALRLFCRAAAREAVTVDLVRRALAEVRRAGRR